MQALAYTRTAQRIRSDPDDSRGAFYTATAALNTTRISVPTRAAVAGVAASPNGHTLASAGRDNSTRSWDLTDRAAMTTIIDSLRRGVLEVPAELAQLGCKWRRFDARAYFDHYAFNGPTEAITGRLEALPRNTLGFRNLTHHRIRSLLHCGNLTQRIDTSKYLDIQVNAIGAGNDILVMLGDAAARFWSLGAQTATLGGQSPRSPRACATALPTTSSSTPLASARSPASAAIGRPIASIGWLRLSRKRPRS